MREGKGLPARPSPQTRAQRLCLLGAKSGVGETHPPAPRGSQRPAGVPGRVLVGKRPPALGSSCSVSPSVETSTGWAVGNRTEESERLRCGSSPGAFAGVPQHRTASRPAGTALGLPCLGALAARDRPFPVTARQHSGLCPQGSSRGPPFKLHLKLQ